MTGLSLQWTQHLRDPEAKKDFEKLVRNSTQLLTRLKQIIFESEASLRRDSYSVEDFRDPNWSHKQAFRNGELAQLQRLKQLIPF